MSTTNQLPAILGTLDSLGVPMWLTATRSGKQIPPRGWPTLTAADNRARLAHWKPGMAVCGAVTGRWAFVDVDTKAGASIEAAEAWLQGLGVSPWARISTPSGGAHFYVSGAPGQANYPGETVAKLTGLVGVEVFGGIAPSAHFAFLPGSERPKYPGKGYTVEWEHLELIDADATPLWNALAHAAAERRTGQGSPEEGAKSAKRTGTDTPPPSHPSEGRPRAEAYTRSVVDGEADKLARTAQGGRNNQLHQAALKIGSGTMLTLNQTIAALEPPAQACGLEADSGRAQVIATIRSGHAAGSAARRDTPATNPDSVGVTPNLVTPTPAGQLGGMSVMDMAPGDADLHPEPVAGRQAVITRPEEVRNEKPHFVKDLWYPIDNVTIVAGAGGEGKSTLILADVAAGTRGELEGDITGRPVRTLLTSTEDMKSYTRARLTAAGADMGNWAFLDIGEPASNGKVSEVLPTIPADLPVIRQALVDFGADLWVIDPLSNAVHGNLNKAEVVRPALMEIAMLAAELHIAVVTVLHLKKGQSIASEKISGSHEFRSVVRSVLLLAHDRTTGERVITVNKSTFNGAEGMSWNFTLEPVDMVSDDGEPMTVARAVIGGRSERDVDDIMNQQYEARSDPEAADCATWLKEWALSEGGTLSAKEVQANVSGAGYSMDQAKRAKRKLDMKSEKVGFGNKGEWVWIMPNTEGGTKSAKGADTDTPPPSPPMGERPDPAPSPSVLHSADLPGFRATRHPAAAPESPPEPLDVNGIVPGRPTPTYPKPAPTPAGRLDPDWLLFPGSTTCKVCGNDLLTETGSTGRCRAHHQARGAA